MTTLDNLNAAFDMLKNARRCDDGTPYGASEIVVVVRHLSGWAEKLLQERQWPPIPTLNPLPPVMSEQQLKEKLQ